MNQRTTLRIGGVPEHFNMPWQIAIESGAAAESGIDPVWVEYTTGTGAMLADLSAGKLDLAMLLTEGAALGIARNEPVEAISLYTTSPLIWGVHVPAGSGFDSLGGLRDARFGISRPGSGSHLMSLALAMAEGWPVDQLQFEIVDNLPGAITAFAEDRADVFMWEHFTTQPAVDAGHFRRIGDFVSPWPAWVICANRQVWQRQEQTINRLVDIVAGQATQLAGDPEAARLIAGRYGLETAAVSDWLARTKWVSGRTSPDKALESATQMLKQAGAI
jgi:sulfonate transport system substrate-binding protein